MVHPDGLRFNYGQPCLHGQEELARATSALVGRSIIAPAAADTRSADMGVVPVARQLHGAPSDVVPPAT